MKYTVTISSALGTARKYTGSYRRIADAVFGALLKDAGRGHADALLIGVLPVLCGARCPGRSETCELEENHRRGLHRGQKWTWPK